MKITAVAFILSFILAGAVHAQEQSVDDTVNRMTMDLHLTEQQTLAVRPVIKGYMAQRQEFLQGLQGQVSIDKNAAKAALKEFRQQEVRKLSQILTADQMEKWVQQQALHARLNHGQDDATGDDDGQDDVTLSPNGATFHF